VFHANGHERVVGSQAAPIRFWNEVGGAYPVRTRCLDKADVKYHGCVDRVPFPLTEILSVGKKKRRKKEK
jgi:hypothetical protein